MIGVDKSLADGEAVARWALQVDANEGARHGRIAGEEERAAFLDETGEPVANGIRPHVRPAVAHSDDNGGGLAIICHG